LISEADVEDLLPAILEICDGHQIPATFFEITTALAFCHFHRQQVEYAVFETGMGYCCCSLLQTLSPAGGDLTPPIFFDRKFVS
jgi:hypothetical protein